MSFDYRGSMIFGTITLLAKSSQKKSITSLLFPSLDRNGTERLNDIHILDTKTSNWTCPHVGGVLPHPRAGMTLTACRGRLYLFGGSGTSAKCFQDLQILDRQEMAWLDVTPDENGGGGQSSGLHCSTSADEADMANRFSFASSTAAASSSFLRYGDTGCGPSVMSDDGAYSGPDYFMDDSEQQQRSPQQGGDIATSCSRSSFHSTDWRSRDLGRTMRRQYQSPNPNDEDVVPTVLVQGRGPGRRAGHTATAVNRKIYIFGGSCGSDYLNDFWYVMKLTLFNYIWRAVDLALHDSQLCFNFFLT